MTIINFHLEAYINDVTSFNWNNIISSSEFNLDEKTVKIIDSLKAIIDKHAPLKLASKSKAKQLSKPWLTNDLLKSIKNIQKTYRSHYLSKTPAYIETYKQYANDLAD